MRKNCLTCGYAVCVSDMDSEKVDSCLKHGFDIRPCDNPDCNVCTCPDWYPERKFKNTELDDRNEVLAIIKPVMKGLLKKLTSDLGVDVDFDEEEIAKERVLISRLEDGRPVLINKKTGEKLILGKDVNLTNSIEGD